MKVTIIIFRDVCNYLARAFDWWGNELGSRRADTHPEILQGVLEEAQTHGWEVHSIITVSDDDTVNAGGNI